ncbi:MAG: TetR/AcrR family transcriptional regulator [Desulfobacteraceae bacterium]|nr:TetR/AcrR family transcriptional regulator [Desulfobacteraceae bacterium]
MEAAVKEFIEKGYHGASMQSIADRAGLSKGGIYHHFKSKDEILIEANTRYYMQPVFKIMEEALANESPVKGLTDYITNYLTHWSNHPKEMSFVFLSLSKFLDTEELWSEFDDEYIKNMISFYEGLLLRGIECNELKEHDTRGRAKILFSSLDGVIGYLVMSKSMDTEETIEQYISLFIEDILKD